MRARVNGYWTRLLDEVERDLILGRAIGFDLAVRLTDLPDDLVPALGRLANAMRRRESGRRVDLCSIISARTGACAEDCAFCAQSKHHSAECAVESMRSADEIVAAAKRAEANGVHRFCIVTSGGALSDADFEVAVSAVARIAEETALRRCASLGSLSPARIRRLAEAGLNRYHHNLETCRSFFGKICTTHTWEERAAVVRSLKAHGIETCCGGILNMGESPRQRVEFAFELRALRPDSVPINFLDPRPGTPLAARARISALEAAKYLAIFRLVLPHANLRLAGGRTSVFAEEPALPFRVGADGLLVGDLLTTSGPAVRDDLDMLGSLGLDVGLDA